MRWSTPALWTVLFGVAATIASAWLCALVSPLSDAEFLISSSNTGLSAPRPARWRVGVPEDWTIRTWLARSGVGTRHDTVSECIWMGSTLGSSEATNPNRTKVMLTTGWPLPAMQATAWDVTAPTASRSTYFRTSWENGLQLRAGVDGYMKPPRNLPLRPVWWAFALNTAWWGAVWIFARWSFLRARANRRKRLVQCVACGYPLGGSSRCSECGAAASPSRGTA